MPVTHLLYTAHLNYYRLIDAAVGKEIILYIALVTLDVYQHIY